MKNSKMNQSVKNNDLVKAFMVFKDGTTFNWEGTESAWHTILLPESDFNGQTLQKKIDWYTYLGYTIKNI